MWTATSSTKCCATCTNWGGDRKVGPVSVETPSVGTRGKCYERVITNPTQGPMGCDGRNCLKYRKLAGIR